MALAPRSPAPAPSIALIDREALVSVGRPSTAAARPASAGRVADILVSLTVSDLRARYGRGPWQLIKWLVDPFALVGVYLLLVAFVLDRPGTAPGLSLACAVVPFQLVMMTVINAMQAVAHRRAIVLNMSFDRILLPISSVLTESVAFAGSLLLFALMMALYGVAPTAALVWLPLVLAATIAFALAIAYPASLFGTWFSDLRTFAISFVRVLFFIAPGLVPLAEIPGRANDLVRLNPLTALFEAYRAVLLYGERPATWQIVFPLAVAALLTAAFVPLYRREQRQFAKLLG